MYATQVDPVVFEIPLFVTCQEMGRKPLQHKVFHIINE